MLAQKSVSQYGDGEGALACWKNSMADYHDEKKVNFTLVLPSCVPGMGTKACVWGFMC